MRRRAPGGTGAAGAACPPGGPSRRTRPRSGRLDLYRWLFGRYLAGQLGKAAIGDIDAPRVRSWRAGLIEDGVSATMVAKAYRLLRAILMTAVDDGVLARNPCRIRGAGSENAAARPVLTVAQVFDLADRVPARYQLLVLVATFGSLRWGEVTALRRCDVDTGTGVVRIQAAFTERSTGEIIRSLPKSRAGTRIVTLPAPVVRKLVAHLADVAEEPESLIFTGQKGGPIRRSTFNRAVKWREVVTALGVPGLHFHDLRHTGNHLAASTGASLRDLMNRMGHDSMRAALIYQHATRAADTTIAGAMADMIDEHANDEEEDDDDGAAGALVPAS